MRFNCNHSDPLTINILKNYLQPFVIKKGNIEMPIIIFIKKFLFSNKLVFRTSRKVSIYFGLIIYGYLVEKYKKKDLNLNPPTEKLD